MGRIIKSVSLSGNEAMFAVSLHHDPLQLWDISSQQCVEETTAGYYGRYIVCSHGGENIAAIFGRDEVGVWILDDGALSKHTLRKDRHINDVLLSSDGGMLIYSDEAGSIVIWDVVSAVSLSKPLHEIPVDQLQSVAIRPDKMAFGLTNGSMLIWDLLERKLIRSSQFTEDHINSLEFSPDGRIVVSSSGNGLYWWDTTSVRAPSRPHSYIHTQVVTCISFSLDGSRLVSGSADKTVRIWHGRNGSRIGISMDQGARVNYVGVSKEGDKIVSASEDSQVIIKIWSMTRQELLYSFRPHPALVAHVLHMYFHGTCVRFFHDGLRLAHLPISNSQVASPEARSNYRRLIPHKMPFSRQWQPVTNKIKKLYSVEPEIQVFYDAASHCISIVGYQQFTFKVPNNFHVSAWKARFGIIFLLSLPGRDAVADTAFNILVLDCRHIISVNGSQ